MKQGNQHRKSYRTEDGRWVLWLDKRGRVTLPKAFMQEHGWEIGDTLTFEVRAEANGRLALRVSNPDAEARERNLAPDGG